jgi:hypothetical protein
MLTALSPRSAQYDIVREVMACRVVPGSTMSNPARLGGLWSSRVLAALSRMLLSRTLSPTGWKPFAIRWPFWDVKRQPSWLSSVTCPDAAPGAALLPLSLSLPPSLSRSLPLSLPPPLAMPLPPLHARARCSRVVRRGKLSRITSSNRMSQRLKRRPTRSSSISRRTVCAMPRPGSKTSSRPVMKPPSTR